MASPTFVAEYETAAWNTTGDKSVSVTVATGDALVVLATSEDNGSAFTPSGGSLTYTSQQSIFVASDCGTQAWTVDPVGSGQTFTLQITNGSGAKKWGFNVLRFSGASGFTSAKTNSTGAPSLSITTTQDNSAIAIINGDWNAADGTTRTWRTVNGSAATEQSYARDSAAFTAYVGYHADAGTAGAKTVGLSAPSGQQFAIIAVEIKGSASTAVAPHPPLVVPSLAATQRASW